MYGLASGKWRMQLTGGFAACLGEEKNTERQVNAIRVLCIGHSSSSCSRSATVFELLNKLITWQCG